MNDFLLAQQDFSQMDDFDLVGTYLAQTNPEYSDDDIAFFMEDKFIPAEGEEERSARSKALAMKQELQKAKEYFSNMQERYHTPLESSAENVPEDYQKALEFYKQYNDEEAKVKELEDNQRRVFQKILESILMMNSKVLSSMLATRNCITSQKILKKQLLHNPI